MTFLESRVGSVLDGRYHGQKTLSSAVICCWNWACLIVGRSICWLLIFKIDLLRSDSLPRCLCNAVGFIGSVFSEISGLWEFVFHIKICFSLGVGAAIVGFVDGILKVELFLPLEKVEDGFVVPDCISVESIFLCGTTHNDIIALSLKI